MDKITATFYKAAYEYGKAVFRMDSKTKEAILLTVSENTKKEVRDKIKNDAKKIRAQKIILRIFLWIAVMAMLIISVAILFEIINTVLMAVVIPVGILSMYMSVKTNQKLWLIDTLIEMLEQTDYVYKKKGSE